MSLEAYFQLDGDRRPRSRAAARRRDRHLPGQRLLPGALRPRCARAARRSRSACARSRAASATPHDFELRDADRRDPGALRRPVDARDADALPRPPPGPGRAPTSSTPRGSTASTDAEEFIQRASRRRRGSSRWSGFVAGLPFLFQMVPRERQLEVPKYVRPRTDTPALTVGHGGCFGCIYSVRGAGGYQMFGITPVPIYDPGQDLPDFEDFMVLLQAGRHRQVRADRRATTTTSDARRSQAGRSAPTGAGHLRSRGVPGGPRRLQRALLEALHAD